MHCLADVDNPPLGPEYITTYSLCLRGQRLIREEQVLISGPHAFRLNLFQRKKLRYQSRTVVC